jgi:hypothetical protein
VAVTPQTDLILCFLPSLQAAVDLVEVVVADLAVVAHKVVLVA